VRALVVGLGNPVLRDDAVGIRLARDFRRRWEGRPAPSVPPEVSSNELCFYEECSVGGLALVEHLVDHDLVIILDSIRTQGGRPGDWYSFNASALRRTMNLSNVHDTNFATALELSRRMGLVLPPDDRIAVFAVEIEDNLTFDERMSDALEAAYPEYAEAIFAEIGRLLES
jgi:hydrogenase maturation protease